MEQVLVQPLDAAPGMLDEARGRSEVRIHVECDG